MTTNTQKFYCKGRDCDNHIMRVETRWNRNDWWYCDDCGSKLIECLICRVCRVILSLFLVEEALCNTSDSAGKPTSPIASMDMRDPLSLSQI